jgi:MSHA biogenesis protein MshI
MFLRMSEAKQHIVYRRAKMRSNAIYWPFYDAINGYFSKIACRDSHQGSHKRISHRFAFGDAINHLRIYARNFSKQLSCWIHSIFIYSTRRHFLIFGRSQINLHKKTGNFNHVFFMSFGLTKVLWQPARHGMEKVLKLFRKKARESKGLVGISEQSNGIGIALVEYREDGAPRLACCDFAFCEEGHGRHRAITELIDRHNLESFPCVGVMALGSYDLLQIVPPDVADNERAEAVRWQVSELINYPIEDAVVDHFEVPTRGHEARAYVVVTPVDKVRKKVDFLRGSKLAVHAIDIPELAVRNFAAYLPESAKGVGILFFGPQQGTIMIIRERQIYLTRSIQVGLSQLYEFSDAPPSEGSEKLQFLNLLDSISLEVQRTFDFYERSSALTPIDNLLVVPTERPIPDLIPHLENYLSADVRLLDLNSAFEVNEFLSPEIQARCIMAIGAALREFEVER